MKKTVFSPVQAHRITQLIRKKNLANNATRRSIIDEIRGFGFDHTRLKLHEEFTEDDFYKNVIIKSRTNRKVFSGRYLTIFAVLLLPYLFKGSFEEFIDTLLVNPIASKLNNGVLSDILFGIFLFSVIVWLSYGKLILKKSISWATVLVAVYVSSLISLYRFSVWGFDYWEFVQTSCITSIKYIDLILCFSALLFLYKVIPPGDKPKKDSNAVDYKLFDDSHITTVSQDTIGRIELAEYLAKYIVNSDSDRSFAIGVNAKWGDGKTSFNKLVLEFLYEEDHDILTMEFNPWKSPDSQKIIKDFFREYANLLKLYDFRLGTKLISYSKSLISEERSWWSEIIRYFQNFNNSNTEFQQINRALKDINRRIVVLIEDLDRLSSDEIMELIKLIRNSANFRNTFFIVGFDRNYLQEVLKKRTEYGETSFLDKVFQLQVDLSHIPDGLVLDALKNALTSHLIYSKDVINSFFDSPTETVQVSDIFEGKIDSINIIPRLVTNLRDIKRFVNFFSISFRLVKTDVVFEEYFYAALLKFKFPLLITQIKRNRLILFESEPPISGFPYKKINENELAKLFEDSNVEQLDKLNQDLILQIFKNLLEGKQKDRRSISYPDKFELYFDNSLNSQSLLFGEFVPLLDKDWKEIKYQILQWVEEKKAAFIIDIINSLDPYTSPFRIEKISNIWVLLINYNQYPELCYDSWLKLFGDKEKLKLFGLNGPVNLVKKLFNVGSQEFFYTTYILRLVLRNYIDEKEFHFPLTKEECQEVSTSRLREFVKSRREFDRRVFDLFYYNCWGSKDGDRVILLQEANSIILDYVKKFETQYLRFVIRPLDSYQIDLPEYTFEPFIPQYFGDWGSFEKFIVNIVQDSSFSADEFIPMLEYFQEFKKSNYKSFFAENPPQWIKVDEKTQELILSNFKHQTYDKLIEEYRSGTL